MSPAPVLKWVGGKRQLLPEILPRIPARIDVYHEPFLGGAAVFFALAGEGRFQKAVLSDANWELVNFYRALRDFRLDVPNAANRLPFSEADYYQIRTSNPGACVDRAARFLYLNKTGFNGLWRVNKKGACNVPWGKHKERPVLDDGAFLAAADALAGKEILTIQFRDMLKYGYPGPGHFFYLDPPYVPASKSANFTAYTADGFGPHEQAELVEIMHRIEESGASFLLSNADTPETRELYRDFSVEAVSARRNINCNGTGRGHVGEILVSPKGARRA